MEFVKYSVKDRICTITLSRPDKRNALNAEVVEELKSAFKDKFSNTIFFINTKHFLPSISIIL